MESQRVRRPEGPQDWKDQRAVITDLYITQGLELEDLMEIMQERHYFKATKKQYKTYFTNWKLRKNVRPSEYSAIIKKKRKREEEGKDSAFRLRGAMVNDSKIIRYEKKTKRGDEHEIAEAGTPDDLSCFTPSPVASSPNAPSPVLPQFQSPNLLCVSIDLPSKRNFFVPSPLLLFPEAPDHEVDRIFNQFIMPLAALGSRVSLTVDDIIKAATCQRMERFAIFLPHLPKAKSSFTRLLSGCIERAREGMTSSGIRRFASLYLILFEMIFHIGIFSGFLTRRKPASADLATERFPRSLRINHITTPSDVPGGANDFEISITALGRQTVITFPDLTTKDQEQMHNSRVHRSESCESTRSIDSFLSDPVVDWKDLLYGYNR